MPASVTSSEADLLRRALRRCIAAPSASNIASVPKPSRFAGLASWYGSVLHGHRTASGERFDSNALTACHRTLPFGTLVRVINLLNNRSVLVRINDRGVLKSDRVIDLSSAAAERLDMIRAGVAPVRLEIEKTMSIARGPEPSRSGMPEAQTQSAESR